ncbi:MAG TPA: DNA polymerase, partial [Dehalococcoidia bacterium]|nr:DNA polymerase [Dehalococcoidia bacterium]
EIRSPNRQVRASGERMAVNMPIQGSQADLIKIAMVRLDDALRRNGLRSRMLLQVHDELIFECPSDELDSMRSLCLEIMPNALPLCVPVEIDFKVGRTWGDAE